MVCVVFVLFWERYLKFLFFYLFILFKVSSKQESEFSHMCNYAFHILLRISLKKVLKCIPFTLDEFFTCIDDTYY